MKTQYPCKSYFAKLKIYRFCEIELMKIGEIRRKFPLFPCQHNEPML